MSKKNKTALIVVLVILLVGLPLVGYWVFFSPHTYRFFIDRERVSEEFSLDLTDDVKLVSYYDGSILIAIDTELTVEVSDPDSFMRDNIRQEILPCDSDGYGDYRYEHSRIYITSEPYGDKYRVHLRHME